MNDRDKARYNSWKRALAFRDARAAQFPAAGKAAAEFSIVETSIATFDAAESKQSGGKQQIKVGTTSKSVLLDALRLDLEGMARTSRSIEAKENMPGYAENFGCPAAPVKMPWFARPSCS